MYALVKDNSIVESFIQEKAMTIDTIQYPKNIFKLWSNEELNKIGIYKIALSGQEKNTEFYDNTYKDEFKDGGVTRTYTNTEKNLSDCQKILVEKINFNLSDLLKSTDWIVIREQETSKAKPSDLATWRTNLRTKHAELETAINNASSVSELEAIDINSGWPEDPRT